MLDVAVIGEAAGTTTGIGDCALAANSEIVLRIDRDKIDGFIFLYFPRLAKMRAIRTASVRLRQFGINFGLIGNNLSLLRLNVFHEGKQLLFIFRSCVRRLRDRGKDYSQ